MKMQRPYPIPCEASMNECRARVRGCVRDLSPGSHGRRERSAMGVMVAHALSLVDAVVVEAHEDTVVALNLP